MYVREASPLLKQIWAMSSVLLFNVGCGMMNARTTLELSFIQEQSPMKVDSETSWIGTMDLRIITLGLLSSALLLHCFGRRTAFIVNIFASIMSCCTIYFATNTAVTIGRMFRDFASSGVILGAMVIGEYASPVYRGVFITLAAAAIEFGRLTAYFIGNNKIIAIFALVLSILSLIVVCTWNKSPYFLASRYKYDECKKSFIWLRGTGFKEIQELTKLIQKGKEAESKIRKKKRISETLLDAVKEVTKRKLAKPIVVILFASILIEASGKHIFDTYGTQIVDEKFGKYSLFYISSIHTLAPISMIFSSILIKVLKIKTLLFYTGFTIAILSFIISFTLFLISNTVISYTSILPLGLLIYLVLTNLSCSTIYLIWCGELFPLEHKSVGLVISGLIINLNNYLCLKVTPYLVNGLKLYGLFGLLTLLLTLALLTLYFIAPETHDKTLLEIECYFEKDDFESEDDERSIKAFTVVVIDKPVSHGADLFLRGQIVSKESRVFL